MCSRRLYRTGFRWATTTGSRCTSSGSNNTNSTNTNNTNHTNNTINILSIYICY